MLEESYKTLLQQMHSPKFISWVNCWGISPFLSYATRDCHWRGAQYGLYIRYYWRLLSWCFSRLISYFLVYRSTAAICSILYLSCINMSISYAGSIWSGLFWIIMALFTARPMIYNKSPQAVTLGFNRRIICSGRCGAANKGFPVKYCWYARQKVVGKYALH